MAGPSLARMPVNHSVLSLIGYDVPLEVSPAVFLGSTSGCRLRTVLACSF